MNALSVIVIIIEYKNLMEIIMDNVYAKKVIMIIIRIIHVNNVLHFGLFYN